MRAAAGSAARKCSTENGLYRWTWITPTFSPRSEQVLDRLARVSAPEPIKNDDALGIRCAEVVEQAVVPPGQSAEPLHCLLDDGRRGW